MGKWNTEVVTIVIMDVPQLQSSNQHIMNIIKTTQK